MTSNDEEDEIPFDGEKTALLLESSEQIPDPRHKRGIRYRYADLLLMCIYGVLSGYSDAVEVEYYVEQWAFQYFHELLGIERAPSHDTFSRIMQMTSWEALSKTLGEWLYAMFPETCEKYADMKVLHVDGKAVRAASNKSKRQKPVYEMNAMYEGESIGVIVQQVGDKENEISALPEFLSRFDLRDTIVTLDAIGCNQTVIKTILDGQGHYAVPVKGNQKALQATILDRIDQLTQSGEFQELPSTGTHSKRHGRIEKVKMHLIEDTGSLYEALGTDSFYGSIGKVAVMDKRSTYVQDGKEVTTDTRSLIITDLEDIDVETMLKLKTSHWNIEMQHWLLDVQLREDQRTSRKGNATINGSILRRFCLMVKNYDPELSDQPMKRFLMANDHSLTRIEKLLFGTVAQA